MSGLRAAAMVRGTMLRSLLLCMLFAVAFSCAKAGTVVEIRMPIGTIGVELYDEDKPITVSNFLNYVTTGRYENTFAHRLAYNSITGAPFVLQGGGFAIEGSDVVSVDTFDPIQNEYSAGQIYSNTFGTIAMARVGGQVNSATSQWFINLGDNADLDTVDEGFTVFGTCIYALDGNGDPYASAAEFLNAISSAFSDADTVNYVVRHDFASPFGELPVTYVPESGSLPLNSLLYTDIVVVPEPAVAALLAAVGSFAVGAALRRRAQPRTR